jgi:hypothetical protein
MQIASFIRRTDGRLDRVYSVMWYTKLPAAFFAAYCSKWGNVTQAFERFLSRILQTSVEVFLGNNKVKQL